jgi:beta-lactam-binding protein with PASTA domain
VSFAAIIQTLKSDPELVNVIHKIPTTNDSEQRKDIDINITKYLESNKNNILDLAEKNYEDLVEVLTNNAIDTVITESSSNPTLALPQSLLTYPNPSNHIIHTEKKT